jgi:hypothetical protein
MSLRLSAKWAASTRAGTMITLTKSTKAGCRSRLSILNGRLLLYLTPVRYNRSNLYPLSSVTMFHRLPKRPESSTHPKKSRKTMLLGPGCRVCPRTRPRRQCHSRPVLARETDATARYTSPVHLLGCSYGLRIAIRRGEGRRWRGIGLRRRWLVSAI